MIYLKVMESIKAQELMDQMSVGDFVRNSKNQDRKKTSRALNKLATKYDKIETKSVDDLEGFLKGFMNG